MKGFTLWFTGLSGAGKSTLAERIEETLLERGLYVELLDGDEIRTNLSKGLGFSKEDRDTNIRRIGFVAHLLARNGVVSITAAISPYRSIRNEMREKIGNFVEIYCKCDLDELERRDVKGLYKKARQGLIKNFTGIDDPYEEPESPEVVVDTATQDEDESLEIILRYLESHGWIPAEGGKAYTPDQEKAALGRLQEKGYI